METWKFCSGEMPPSSLHLSLCENASEKLQQKCEEQIETPSLPCAEREGSSSFSLFFLFFFVSSLHLPWELMFELCSSQNFKLVEFLLLFSSPGKRQRGKKEGRGGGGKNLRFVKRQPFLVESEKYCRLLRENKKGEEVPFLRYYNSQRARRRLATGDKLN